MTINTALTFVFFLVFAGFCTAVHLRAERHAPLQRIVVWGVLGAVAFGGWQNTQQPEFAADEMGQSLVVAGFFWLAVALAVREIALVLARLRAWRGASDLPHS